MGCRSASTPLGGHPWTGYKTRLTQLTPLLVFHSVLVVVRISIEKSIHLLRTTSRDISDVLGLTQAVSELEDNQSSRRTR